MKKYIFTILCILVAVATNAQDVMVIEKNDNTTAKFSVDDIRRVYFENSGGGEIIPSNTVLSSRLKDKNGRTVLLEGIKDMEGNWILKYDYNKDGMLVGFQEKKSASGDSDTTVFDGLSYTSNCVIKKQHLLYKVQITLNEQGLISKNVAEVTPYDTSGDVARSSKFAIFFTYNDKMQMTKWEITEYNDDGTVKPVSEEDDDTFRQFVWTNDNLVFNGESRIFSGEENITKQPIVGQCLLSYGGFQPMVALGLYGVGSANFTRSEAQSYTLNENGTIATLHGSHYCYK